MRWVSLHHDGTAGGERGGRVPASDGEGEREVTRPEHRDRAERDEHPPHVRRRSQRGLAGVVDRGLDVTTVAEHVTEHPQLDDRPRQLRPLSRPSPRPVPASAVATRSTRRSSSDAAMASSISGPAEPPEVGQPARRRRCQGKAASISSWPDSRGRSRDALPRPRIDGGDDVHSSPLREIPMRSRISEIPRARSPRRAGRG